MKYKKPPISRKKQQFDKNKVDFFFKKGDLVSIFTPRGKEGLSYKLTIKNHGPFTVVKRLSDVHYRVKPGVRNEPFQTVHVRRMMRYYPEPVDTDSDSEYGSEQNLNEKREHAAAQHSGGVPQDDASVHKGKPRAAEQKQKQTDSAPRDKPTIIDSKPGQNGDFSQFLLRVGNEQFWVTKEELSPDLLLEYEATRRRRRASRRAKNS